MKRKGNRNLTEEQIANVVELYRKGMSCREVAIAAGTSPSNVSRINILHGANRPKGGANRKRECRLIIDGHYRRWSSLRQAARSLGYRYEHFRFKLKTGSFSTWSADKFREHPGLDTMPTPYPFETKSREILEAKCGRKKNDVQNAGN